MDPPSPSGSQSAAVKSPFGHKRKGRLSAYGAEGAYFKSTHEVSYEGSENHCYSMAKEAVPEWRRAAANRGKKHYVMNRQTSLPSLPTSPSLANTEGRNKLHRNGPEAHCDRRQWQSQQSDLRTALIEQIAEKTAIYDGLMQLKAQKDRRRVEKLKRKKADKLYNRTVWVQANNDYDISDIPTHNVQYT